MDPNERIRFRNLISELAEERIVLLSTHIVSDVEYIANDMLLMKDGRIVLSGASEELITSMPERVWSCTLTRQQVSDYMKKYKVANVKTVSGGTELRILSADPPSEDAVLEATSLEDVFLYYFGEKAGTDDVQI